MAKTLNDKIEHAEVMPFPIELSHSTSRSASEQQEPTDITIVSTNIDIISFTLWLIANSVSVIQLFSSASF
jgi:hypothetical protein